MTRRSLCVALLCGAAAVQAATPYVVSPISPPPLTREFRGAWVATVSNIDWPSKPGLPTATQKQELVAILDRAQHLKLNVIILQVRPMCDALYASKLEPWSEYLTGKMGQAPEPSWDPLQFAIAEAHQRGLELHAWFNPFRARHTSASSPPANNHISKTRPALVKTYGKQLWLDPGFQETHDYSARVILDVVKRYDIDGVHIDDYFYPYREKDAQKKDLPFPDWTSWNNYVKSGGRLSRDDWRRDNVNRFVQRMYRDVKSAKPWVKVGISPFGIYRPGFPEQIKGFDQFDSIYADPRTWLANGWLDYLAPQLYWRIDPPAQSFPVLLKWWTENNPKNKQIVAGINSAALGNRTNPWPPGEILRQVAITRQQAGVAGHIHWNVSALLRNRGGVTDELAAKTYIHVALPPPVLVSSPTPAPAPKLEAALTRAGARFRWSSPHEKDVRFWIVQFRRGASWQTEILPRGSTAREIASAPDAFAVRAVDRFGHAGRPAVLSR